MNIRTLILEAIEDEIRIRKEIEELYDINKGTLRFKTKSGELLVLGLESVLITDKTISDKLGIPHFLYYSFNRYFGDRLFPFSLKEQNFIKSIGLEDKQYNISDKKNNKYYCFKLIKAYLNKYKDLSSALQAYLSISKNPEEAKQDAQNILSNYNMLETALKRYNELIRQYREDLSDKQAEQPKKQPPVAATENDEEESEEEVTKDEDEEEAPSAQETPRPTPAPSKPKFKVGDKVVYIKDPDLGYYVVKSIDGDRMTLQGEGDKVFTDRAELYRLK